MTEAEATLIAGMELIADYEYQCERDPDLQDIVPLSSFLEQNLYQATQNVIKRNNGNQTK
jgi:hypothetical protein